MIIKNINGDIFTTEAKHIAFAINTEGYNDAGFAGKVSEIYWPELANCGKNRKGTVLSKEVGGKTYHALVCHSLDNGWGDKANQTETIRKCFNKIESNGEPIASIAIGTGFIGQMDGASFNQILYGMHKSKQNIILYSGFDMEQINSICTKLAILEDEDKVWQMDPNKKYEIIEAIINNTFNAELINIIKSAGFKEINPSNVDVKKQELLEYLKEMKEALEEKQLSSKDAEKEKILAVGEAVIKLVKEYK